MQTPGANTIVLDFFNTNLLGSKISMTNMKMRLTLLNNIVRVADADAKLLSNSSHAKFRLFAHFQGYCQEQEKLLAETKLWAGDLDDQTAKSKDSSRLMATTIVEALNLNDDRVARCVHKCAYMLPL